MKHYFNDTMILVNTFVQIIFSFIYIILFFAVLYHIIRNLCKKGFTIHWIEYLINISLIISFIIIYIMYQMRILKVKKIEKCLDNNFCQYLNIHIFIMDKIFLSNIILNLTHSIGLCRTINKLISIKATGQSSFVNELKKVGIKKTTKKKTHIIELFLIDLIMSLYFYIMIKSVNNKQVNMFNLVKSFFIILQIFIILSDSFMIYILKFYKKKILENNYYNQNLVLLAIYNISSSKIVFYSDFLTFKSINDLCLVMGSLFFIMLESITISNIIIILIIWVFYLFFGGLLLLYVDKSNRIKINYYIGRIFLLKFMNLDFGEKEKSKLFDEYLLDLNPNETLLVDDLDIYDNDEAIPLELELGSKNKILNGYQSINFYLIFKLIYQYYKNNENTYKQIDNCYENQTDKKNIEKNLENLISEIQFNFNFSYNLILTSVDDKQFYDEFDLLYKKRKTSIEFYNLSNGTDFNEKEDLKLLDNDNVNNEKEEFKIESLLSNNLIQLYPYYKIKILDIIDSFSPSMNQFSTEQFRDSKISNYYMNTYYTYDNFLYFEIYDYNYHHFISNDKLKYFGNEYLKYIKEISEKDKKTFIPFIINIFRIRYYDYDKIIILYKNPISFLPLISSKLNIQITLSENKEKDRVSLPIEEKSNEKNSNSFNENQNIIQLNEYNVNLIIEIIKNDSNFIRKLNFDIFPKLNLFIMTDISSLKENDISTITEVFERIEDSILEIEGEKRKRSNSIINKINSNIKEYGSILISNIELFGLCSSKNRQHGFKIYFEEFFRMSLNPNLKDIIKGDIDNNLVYLNYLIEQLSGKFNSDIDIKNI